MIEVPKEELESVEGNISQSFENDSKSGGDMETSESIDNEVNERSGGEKSLNKVDSNEGESSPLDYNDENGGSEGPKLKIIEGGLNFISKKFEDMGNFYGLIISYDEPYYKVVYEDSDSEELDVHEVEQNLVSMSSVPEDTISTLKRIAKSLSLEGQISSAARRRGKKSDSKDDGQYFILKPFGDMGQFYGLVIGYSKPYYKVVYEDGDSEEMVMTELREYLVPRDSVNEETRNILYSNENSLKKKPTSTSGSEEKKRKRENTKLTPKSRKGSKRKVANNDDDLSGTVAASESKRYVLKSFGALGEFYGLVIGFEKPFYKIVYEDGDCEEMALAELNACLVPLSQVTADKEMILQSYALSMTADASPHDFVESKKTKKTTSGKKRKSYSKSEPEAFVTSTPPEESSGKGTHTLLATEEAPLELKEPVENNDNYVSKTFFGFGVFYGIIVSCNAPYYKVLYSDGDSEELSGEEVNANLVSSSVIPTKIKNRLLSHARQYKNGPDRYQNKPVGDTIIEDEKTPICPYSDVSDDNIYQQYIGRSFIDLDENIMFRVKSVCLHVDYDVLLFKYYDEYRFLSDPGLFDDPNNYEYSACSEMLKHDSWCKWTAESVDDSKKNVEKQNGTASGLPSQENVASKEN